MSSPIWPTSLVREIADRRVLVIVGAGASQDCPPKLNKPRLPGWEDFLRGGADLLQDDTKKDVLDFVLAGKLLEAADIIVASAPKGDWIAYVRRVLDHRNVDVGDIYKLLLRLDAKVYVTPNVDRILEVYTLSLDADYRVVSHTESRLGTEIRTPHPLILKYHGTVEDVDHIVFGRKQFYEARADNQEFYSIVEGLLLTHTALFVGHSLRDPDLMLWLESTGINARRGLPHYALMEAMHPAEKDILQTVYNIQVIEYPSRDFDKAKQILRELVDLVEAQRATQSSSFIVTS